MLHQQFAKLATLETELSEVRISMASSTIKMSPAQLDKFKDPVNLNAILKSASVAASSNSRVDNQRATWPERRGTRDLSGGNVGRKQAAHSVIVTNLGVE